MSGMNILQEKLFQLMIEIDEICKKHDIKYYLAGGNALGAVRNQCFLPWDDDVDIYITRDEWNKLRKIIETEEGVIPEGRSFVYNENTDYYRNTIPRYVNNETTSIYKSQVLSGKACGQNIELLIMDPMPNNEKEKEEYTKLLHLYTELLTPYYVVNQNASLEDWKKHYELYESYCDRIENEGEETVLNELEDKLLHYSDEECDTYCMRWGNNILMYKKEDFGNPREEKFEGRIFPIAERAENIFRIAFGDDWMYVPKFKNQITHNGLKDINIAFSEYTDNYISKINRKTVFEKYKKNKRSNAKVFAKRKENKILLSKTNIIIKSKEISNDLDEKKEYLKTLLKNKDYEKILDEFKDYLNLQMEKNIKNNNLIVPISEENLKTILLCMIEQGNYFNANKILRIHKENGPLSKELEEIENLINLCRELSIVRYDKKDAELLNEIIEKNEEKFPDSLDIYRGKLWLMENEAESEEDFKSIEKLCEEILKIYPFDGETMAYHARAKLELGDKEESMNLYKKSIENTRNGLIWKKVEDESGISRIDIERDLIEGRP